MTENEWAQQGPTNEWANRAQQMNGPNRAQMNPQQMAALTGPIGNPKNSIGSPHWDE
jgi:hypothetical protein